MSVGDEPGGQGTRSRVTILNVDDDESGRYLVSRLLRREGFHVKEATTGAEALRLVAENPDLVLLDVNLPDLNGMEVCRLIKSNAQTQFIPVLHLSATAISAEQRAAGLELADAYLTHPVDPLVLMATIRALLRVRKAENSARAAAQQWQTTFDAIGHGLCLLDADGRVQRANRAMETLFGKPLAEITGSRFDEVLAGAERPAGGWPFERARRTRQRETLEVRAGDRWFQITVDPLLDERGHFTGAVRTIVDVSAQKHVLEEREQLLQQLANEHTRLETVLQQMPSGVLIAEAPSGKLVLSNEQAHRILGRKLPLGMGIEDYAEFRFLQPGGRPYAAEQVPLARAILSGASIHSEEAEVVHSDGSLRRLLINAGPLRDRGGFVVAAVSTFQDVTDRKRLEDELRQSQKMEAVGRLAGGVAHDFNNLLTIIGGYGQMVMDMMDAKAPMRKDMEAILEASSRATALTRQLLTFSRRQIVQPRVLDLNRHVTRLNRVLRRVIGEDIVLNTQLKPGLSRIKADPGQIEQVLLNLAVNARDAMPAGGRLSIETSEVTLGQDSKTASHAVSPGRYIMLSVTDNGTGMDAEVRSHLFEPFFTTKPKGKGTGLGLSTVYGIVKQSGGEILVDSEIGRGTTFRIYLPLAEEPIKAEAAPADAVRYRGVETILLVEDEPDVRRLASEMLSRQGYRVLEAGSGPEAMQIWNHSKDAIDLLLTDIIMPQMSGRELADKLVAARPGLKVMYMSGYTDEVIAQHGVLESTTAFVHKPFTQETLARKLRAVLDGGK